MSFDPTEERSIIIGAGLPILIDAVNSETHKSTVTYTKYPVESKRIVSDHGQEQPDEVEMEILATDTPLHDGSNSFKGRHRVVYSELRLWQKLNLPTILVLGLRSYINMHIEDLTTNKSSADGHSVRIQLKFVELQDTDLGLAALAAALLIDSSIAYSVTGKINMGLI